jgi:hypothetical protein
VDFGVSHESPLGGRGQCPRSRSSTIYLAETRTTARGKSKGHLARRLLLALAVLSVCQRDKMSTDSGWGWPLQLSFADLGHPKDRRSSTGSRVAT